MLARRVRVTAVTLVLLIVAAFLGAPVSVLSIVMGNVDDRPLPPTPSALHVAAQQSRSGATRYTEPGHLDSVIDHPEYQLQSAMGHFQPNLDRLIDEVQSNESSLDLTLIPSSLEGGGPIEDLDDFLAEYMPAYADSLRGFGFRRTGLLLAGGRSGGATTGGFGGSSASGDAGRASTDGTSEDSGGTSVEAANRGPVSEVGESDRVEQEQLPGIFFRPGIGDGEIAIDSVLTSPEEYVHEGSGAGPEADSPSGGSADIPVPPVPVPEPATLVLTGVGLAGLVARQRRAARAARRQLNQSSSTIA